MPFVDYELLSSKYPTVQMSEAINILKEFDVFHCLLAGSSERALAVTKRVQGLPKDFIKWLQYCDGGVLFDTIMLTTVSFDAELKTTFKTYGEYFKKEFKEFANIREEWFVFAIAVHSDLYFFDISKNDGKVYQWDIEELIIYAEWESFEDWLIDQINDAIEQIADDNLIPSALKVVVNNE